MTQEGIREGLRRAEVVPGVHQQYMSPRVVQMNHVTKMIPIQFPELIRPSSNLQAHVFSSNLTCAVFTDSSTCSHSMRKQEPSGNSQRCYMAHPNLSVEYSVTELEVLCR